MAHTQLPDAGRLSHFELDDALGKLEPATENLPLDITGARDTTEEALANLLTALETLGLITDSTSAS